MQLCLYQFNRKFNVNIHIYIIVFDVDFNEISRVNVETV